MLTILLLAVNLTLTPGVVRTDLNGAQICSIKWGKDKRFVNESMRKEVFRRYGIPWADRALYETDHFLPRSLGGADDVNNLWPQPLYEAKHYKDRLEVKLSKMVCAGRLPLADARSEILTDWKAAYWKYIGDVVPEGKQP